MASLYLSDSFEVLEQYFVGDAITQANQLIADKLRVAQEVLKSTATPITQSVLGGGTQLVADYAPNALASWKGGARVTINGSSLSTDKADQNFSISGIDVALTSSEAPNDWANPLGKVSLGLQFSVASGRATSLTVSSFSAEAGAVKVSFTGPISLDSSANTVSMPNARFELTYDSDPGAAQVLSTIYFEGSLSLNGNTNEVTGSFNKFGLTNAAGHYFYGDGLNITTAEIKALPSNATETDLLRAVFEGTTDTVYTKADVVLPEGFENAVIEALGNTSVTGNTQNNQITGNSGNNIINGGAGTDTFVTQGTFAQSTGVLNKDGTVTLTAVGGGTDTLTAIESVRFSDATKTIKDVIDTAQVNYAINPSQGGVIQMPAIEKMPTYGMSSGGSFLTTPTDINELGAGGQVALSDNGRYCVQGNAGAILIRDLSTGNVNNITLNEARPYGNYAPVAISDDGRSVFITTWNGFLASGGGLFKLDVSTGSTSRVDVDNAGATVTYQGWSIENGQIDISSDGRFVAFGMRDTVAPGVWSSGQKTNIFVKDLSTGQLEKIDFGNINTYSSNPKISSDGRLVLFESSAELTSRDVSDGSEPDNDLFLFDRIGHTTVRVNELSDGSRFSTGGYGWSADMSADGKKVTFTGGGSYQKLVSNDTLFGGVDPTGSAADVFVKDLASGNIRRISGDINGGINSKISPDGNYVGYQPYVYQSANQSEIVSLVIGERWTAPGTVLTSLGWHPYDNLVQLANDRGVVWSYNQYVGGAADSGDADYIVFDYAKSSATYTLSSLGGGVLPAGVSFNYLTNSVMASSSVSSGTYFLQLVASSGGQTASETFALTVGASTVSVTPSVSAVNEGTGVSFSVSTSNIAAGTLLPYSLDGTGITAADIQGGVLTGVATVGADGKVSIPVGLVGDGRLEGAETLRLSIQGQQSQVTINDTSNIPIVSVSIPGLRVSESGSGSLTYQFSRVGDTSNALSVNFYISGSASASDYSLSSAAGPLVGQQITFSAGSSTATLYTRPVADGVVEGNESVVVSIAASGSYSIGTSSSATGVIDDTRPEVLSVLPADNALSVSPGANLVVTFSEAVVPRAMAIRITELGGNGTTTVIPVNDASQVSFDGAVMTINPTGLLKPSTHYGISWDMPLVADLAGNDAWGVTTNDYWDFTTSAGVNVTGKAYHWNSHALLSGTSLSAQAGNSVPKQTATDGNGDWRMDAVDPGSYVMGATRALTDIGSAITSADALAALRLAVGLNPNAGSAVVSPYQFMAADVVGATNGGADGKVTAADALAILRMAVKLPSAPANEWMFVEDTRDFWDETTNTFTIDRSHASWDKSIAVNANADQNVNLVGILKGDVNGSWAAPAGTPDLDNINTHYFTDLQTQHHVPLAQMGVLV